MHDRRSWLLLLVVCAIASDGMTAAQFGIFRRDSKVTYAEFRDPAGEFRLEYPREWQVVTGVGNVVAVFAQRQSEASFVVERFKMNTSLAPEDVTEVFVQIETDVLKERQPKATDLNARRVVQSGQPVIVIDYARPGLSGLERARQYSFPRGEALFRVTCVALATLSTKYDPIFTHVAGAFSTSVATR